MYDLVVAGAGVAGCMAARRTAEKGFNVLLLDRASLDELGHPWVNGVEKSVFKRVGIEEPSGDEIMPSPAAFLTISPSGTHRLESHSHPTCEVRMREFARRLLDHAIAAGVTFAEATPVEGPLLERDRVRGVIAGGEEVPARVVMDASGWRAVVRRGLPESSHIPLEEGARHMVTAWREQRLFGQEEAQRVPEILGIPPGIGINRVGWRGGYSTLSLHWDPQERILDILVGYKRNRSEESAGEFVRSFFQEKGLGGERIYGGGGLIPVRRSLDVLVDHGILLAGDSACMVIPAHGSGVASSLIAGELAARTICRCLEEDDVSRENLWEYAAAYQRGRGALMAYFDIARIISERLSEDETEKLVGSLMTPADVEASLKAEPLKLSAKNILQRVKAFRHPVFAYRFARKSMAAPRLKKVYENYPARYHPQELKSWREEVRRILIELGEDVDS